MVAPTRPGRANVPIPLRPMTASDVIDGGITVIKASPRAVLTTTAAIVLPMQLLVLAIVRDRPGGTGAAGIVRALVTGFGDSSPDPLAVFLVPVIHSIALVLLTAAIAQLVVAPYYRKQVSVAEALTTALRRSPELLVAWFIVHVAEAIATLGFLVTGWITSIFFVVVTPALIIEGCSPWQAIVRSERLVRTRYGAVMRVVAFMVVVDLVLAAALGGVSFLVSPFDFAPIVAAVLTSGAALVTTPFVAAATTLLYLDLRVRSEGLDLELGIKDHLA